MHYSVTKKEKLKNQNKYRDNNTETYTLPYVKKMTSESSVHKAEHPKPVLGDNLDG